MDRHWLLTSTFYGNRLPGDPHGFVSSVRDTRPDESPSTTRKEHDQVGTEYDRDFPALHQAAIEQLKQPPILIDYDQAVVLLDQFHETIRHRGWKLLAVAIMADHVHWVVGVPGDPDPEKILGDLKAYGSRALNRKWGKPKCGTWWTYSGSKRKKSNEAAIRSAVAYVRDQANPLIVWIAEEYRDVA